MAPFHNARVLEVGIAMVHFLYFHENFHEKWTLQPGRLACISEAELY
jgi:hypothetical protein